MIDLAMYFVLCGIIWKLIEVLSNGEFTQELGGVIGTLIILIFTIIYIIVFLIVDYNWLDIFKLITIENIKNIL